MAAAMAAAVRARRLRAALGLPPSVREGEIGPLAHEPLVALPQGNLLNPALARQSGPNGFDQCYNGRFTDNLYGEIDIPTFIHEG